MSSYSTVSPTSDKVVWIFNHYAETPHGSGGGRHYNLAKELKKHGWRATIVSASTVHPKGTQRFAFRGASCQTNEDGIEFVWVKVPDYHGSEMRRAFNMIVYFFQALRVMLWRSTERPNVVIGSSVHPLAALAALIVARKWRVPFVFEVRDLWPQTLIDMGKISSGGFMARAMRGLERILYGSAERIITLLPKANCYIEEFGVPKEKIIWIPNGANLEEWEVEKSPGSSDSFNVVYFGSHGAANGLDTLLDAIEIIKNKGYGNRIFFRLIGDGPLKPHLRAKAQQLDLQNIFFYDQVTRDEVPSLAAEADAFIICVNNLPGLYRFGVSMNKIFEYMAAGRPIVIASAAANNPVAEAGAGITVAPGVPEDLAQGILSMAALPEETRIEMGNAGRREVQNKYSFQKLGNDLCGILNYLTDRP
ncbi:glycosyltransferase family 4 protein [Castellaniella sp. S9]|uniref:glycosyltransferase family 4 protein n=1 Tax=Castellaniella sp. S9 TaxID=2993652 RepID=UPI0022B5CE04|nr:glycosyltransferase family 4 protein [Castellaniella sp. S9]